MEDAGRPSKRRRTQSTAPGNAETSVGRRSARIAVVGNSVVSTSAGPPRPRTTTTDAIPGAETRPTLRRPRRIKADKERKAREEGREEGREVPGSTQLSTEEAQLQLQEELKTEGLKESEELKQTEEQTEDQREEQTELKETEIPSYAAAFSAFVSREGLEEELTELCRFVGEKLTGRRPIPLCGLEKEYQTVHQLLEQTVVAGEGNSLLLIGARGSGKRAVVDAALSALAQSHRDDFVVVRLNGFLHTDDKIALREIWRQLDSSPVEKASYADTMASLLALLSHPDELGLGGGDGNEGRVSAAVVVVLEEFEQFTQHGRQTLLYVLLDVAQAKKAPVAVVGLTTRVDVTDGLEKRVKSRFSHRSVFLGRPSWAAFAEACRAALRGPDLRLSAAWDEFLEGLFREDAVERHLRAVYSRSRSVADFLRSALVPVGELAASGRPPGARAFGADSLGCPDPGGLPFTTTGGGLATGLLLTAEGLAAQGEERAGFERTYAEYVRLLGQAKGSAAAAGAAATPGRVWGRATAREAWERLQGWGVLGEADVTTLGSSSLGGSLGRWWR